MKFLPLTMAALAITVTACDRSTTALEVADQPSRAIAPIVSVGPDSLTITGQYLVKFRDSAPDAPGLIDRLAAAHGLKIRFRYTGVRPRGFSAANVSATALEALRRNPNVEYVEPNKRAGLEASEPANGYARDRVDQRNLPLDGTYRYDSQGNIGIKIYVIDTGIYRFHNDFQDCPGCSGFGRVLPSYSAYGTDPGTDCNGHGTWVAGVAGGLVHGVADRVTLVSVQAGDCYDTYLDGLVAGARFVTIDHEPGQSAVANMSSRIYFGSQMLDDAVSEAIADGVPFVVAAGNDNQDACLHSPARLPAAITVGATDRFDSRTSFSNYGPCVDVFAPGRDVPTANHTSPTAYTTKSGTSFAAPLVAGIAAIYLNDHPGAGNQEVRDAIVNNATAGVISNVGLGSPNRLAYSIFPLVVTLSGPSYVPCGETAFFSASAQDGIEPYTYTFYRDNLSQPLFTFGNFYSYPGSSTSDAFTLIVRATDDRGVTVQTSQVIYVC
jgi:subtilisin family serine protease